MHPDFDLPSKGRVDGRASSITAAFFQAITPVIPPSDVEVEEALVVLGMAPGNCRCAYCGDPRTEWDHFRAIVKGRQPEYAAIVGPERWSQYQALLDTAVTHLSEAQKVALELQAIIKAGLVKQDVRSAASKSDTELRPIVGGIESR
jgi:hypothetical protein